MGLANKFSKHFVLFSLIPIILSIGIVPSSFAQDDRDVQGGVYDPLVSQEESIKGIQPFGSVLEAEGTYDSPKEQMKKGVAPHNVKCNPGSTLIIRNHGFPACVQQSTADAWDNKGWGVAGTLLDCKGGDIHMHNANTGAVICENQSKAQKYINLGWVAIDPIPITQDPFLPTGRLSQCKGGEIHLQDPSNLNVICENQDQAQKYVNEGWTALDQIPKHTATGLTQCSGGHIPMSGPETGSTVCVKQNRIQKFVAEGFTLLEDVPSKGDFRFPDLTKCKSGNIHLKNPNTGTIICENQSTAPKYVREGWIALDKIPTPEDPFLPEKSLVVCKGGTIHLKNPASGREICENQARAEKYIREGWVALEKGVDHFEPGKTQHGTTPPGHMVTLQIGDVVKFQGEGVNVYVVTLKVSAGDVSVTKVRIQITSDTDSVPLNINRLSADSDSTGTIRIHALNPSSITAAISSYVPGK
jgi:hypothetical protein